MSNYNNRAAYVAALMMFFIYLFAPFSVHAQTGNVILWNKLGSNAEVTNSEVGPGFGINSDSQGGVLYVPGKFGNALATTGGETGGGGYLRISPDQFFAPDKTKGTVAVWIQKRMQEFIAFQTPLVGIFGMQSYDWQGGGENSYETIEATWNNEWDGRPSGLEFLIIDANNNNHFAHDTGWDAVPVGQWVHLAFVWDLAGIDGGVDRTRIYRDGVIVGRYSNHIPSLRYDSDPVKILGHHAYGRFGQPTAYLDNLVVYDYAKTDFSDRFLENPVGCEEGGLPELSALITNKSGAQNARVWTLTLSNKSSCLAENAQIDGLILSQTAGAACTPVITNPLSFPLGVGNIEANKQASGTATVDFTGCPNNARFKATIPFSSNNSAVSGSKTLNNQFR